MFQVREVLKCKPGKVGELRNKFKALAPIMERLGYEPFRLFTDVSGMPFWTLVLEIRVESLDGLLEMEANIMAEPDAAAAMAGYHDLVISGTREFFKVEN